MSTSTSTTLTRTTTTPRSSTSSLLNPSTPSPASRSPHQQQQGTPTAASPLSTATATPTKSLSPSQQPPSPAVSTPGQWQHPRLDEVLRRQNDTRFDSSNLRSLALNASALALSFLAPTLLQQTLPRSLLLLLPLQPTTTITLPTTLTWWALHLLRLLLLLNLTLTLLPLVRPTDPCDDIPLTDAQRFHLRLPPRARPATPAEEKEYVTPPRYERSTIPVGGASPGGGIGIGGGGSDGRGTGSPLSALGGSTMRRSVSGSPSFFGSGSQQQQQQQWRVSPSPLSGASGGSASAWRRSAGTSPGKRRYSFQNGGAGAGGKSSPFSASELDAVVGVGTPSKTAGNKSSVGLNSKWLYEKGRGSPRGSGGAGMGGGWGSGSVFT